jgi:hypothetical protein
MIYVVAYMIIGMVWSGIGITSTIKSVQDKQGSEAAKELAPILGILVVALFTPLWPMFLTIKVINKITRKAESKVPKEDGGNGNG